MAVVRVAKRAEREGEEQSQRNGLLYEVIGTKYKLEYNVYVDSYRDTSITVLSAPDLPVIGSSFTDFADSDAIATCVSIKAKATDSWKLWRVECLFDSDRIVAMVTDNPLNQPPEISWDFVPYERPLVRDAYGVPVVSSSRNAFDPPFPFSDRKSVLRIVRNESTFSHDLARLYTGTLNIATFAGAAPLYAKMNSITGDRQLQNGVLFYQVKYEIELHPLSHVNYILDSDFRDIDGNLYRDKRTAEPLTNQTPQNGRGKSIFNSVSFLVFAITNTDTTLTIPGDHVKLFPPALKPVNSDSIIPGPYWDYKLRIEDEIVLVNAGHGTNNPTIVRGQEGTTAVAHAVNTPVSLEPYYLRFIPPPGPRDWSPLALPVV